MTNNTNGFVIVILVSTLIIFVIVILREDPLSTGILDVFFFETFNHVSLFIS
jgi:hypothetical protein